MSRDGWKKGPDLPIGGKSKKFAKICKTYANYEKYAKYAKYAKCAKRMQKYARYGNSVICLTFILYYCLAFQVILPINLLYKNKDKPASNHRLVI